MLLPLLLRKNGRKADSFDQSLCYSSNSIAFQPCITSCRLRLYCSLFLANHLILTIGNLYSLAHFPDESHSNMFVFAASGHLSFRLDTGISRWSCASTIVLRFSPALATHLPGHGLGYLRISRPMMEYVLAWVVVAAILATGTLFAFLRASVKCILWRGFHGGAIPLQDNDKRIHNLYITTSSLFQHDLLDF